VNTAISLGWHTGAFEGDIAEKRRSRQ